MERRNKYCFSLCGYYKLSCLKVWRHILLEEVLQYISRENLEILSDSFPCQGSAPNFKSTLDRNLSVWFKKSVACSMFIVIHSWLLLFWFLLLLLHAWHRAFCYWTSIWQHFTAVQIPLCWVLYEPESEDSCRCELAIARLLLLAGFHGGIRVKQLCSAHAGEISALPS